jgi:hypothetical protein
MRPSPTFGAKTAGTASIYRPAPTEFPRRLALGSSVNRATFGTLSRCLLGRITHSRCEDRGYDHS